MIKKTNIKVWDSAKRRHVIAGYVIEKVFKKIVTRSHYMKIIGGYGISWDALEEVQNDFGVKTVVVMDKGKQWEWEAPIEDWFGKGIISDYGSGIQVFLAVKYMKAKRLNKRGQRVEGRKKK